MRQKGICVLIAAAATLPLKAGAAAPSSGRIAYVIDGDTFRLDTGERIRIAEIDAPETRSGQAKCRGEIALGQQATRQARSLLTGRTVTIKRVGRSYNRTVAKVKLDGRDLAQVLVDRGIAAWWPRRRARPHWCGRAD